MIEEVVALAAEAVARDFASADRQIARASMFDTRDERLDGPADDTQHVPMGFIDHSQVLARFIAQHHGIHQAARPGDDGRPAAGSPQDRHAHGITGRYLYFFGHPR